MFANNVGSIDRMIRIVIGLAMIAAFFLWPDLSWRWLLWIGLVPLLTGFLGTCPSYSLLGINSRGVRR